jgi:hypothetical protein
MLLAVQLDDEVRRVAAEVSDIPVQGDLPAKLRAVEAGAAQAFPKNVFGLRCMIA